MNEEKFIDFLKCRKVKLEFLKFWEETVDLIIAMIRVGEFE